MAKDYTYKAANIVVAKTGVQGKGQNAGLPYAFGTFETEVTVKGQKKTVKKSFKAFDRRFASGKTLTPASAIAALVESGATEGFLTGQFQEGRARDANDASKGTFQDFHLAFVETIEAHQAFVEARKAARAQAPQNAPADADGLEPEHREDDIPGTEGSTLDTADEALDDAENPFA